MNDLAKTTDATEDDAQQPAPPRKKRAPKPAQVPPKTPPPVEIRPIATPAKMRRRHYGVLFSFLLAVVLPILLATVYLWFVAEDRYASETGFTVRSEESSLNASELLGGLSSVTGGSASTDADILVEYIRSQQMVRAMEERVGLRAHYSEHWSGDPVFALRPNASIEDLTDYWSRIVNVSYDQGAGIINIEVRAFTPEMAQGIAQGIVAQSQILVNELNSTAREDALQYARDDLTVAETRLKQTRQALTAFRTRTQIVDLESEVQGRMGVVTNLQQQLAQELVAYDELSGSTQASDPRLAQYERRIDVIRERIAQERSNMANNNISGTGEDYPTLISEYEGLQVEREFAEQAYTAALANFEAARADMARQSRYLATYVRPTLAESAEYPRRLETLALAGLFLFLLWGIGALIFYSVRDRG